MFGRLFSRLFERKGDLGNPPQALLDALGVWPSSATMSPEVGLKVPAVSAAVRAISEAVACLPLCVYRAGDEAVRGKLGAVHDPTTFAALRAELASLKQAGEG